MQEIKNNKKYYGITNCLMLCDWRLKTMYKLFYFYKNYSGFYLYQGNFTTNIDFIF